MDSIGLTISNYSSSLSAINIEQKKQEKESGKTIYDGSKIDNLSLRNGKLVSFVNSDGDIVKVYLNDEVVESLESKFGSNNFADEDENNIVAKQDAETYLSGFWDLAKSNILSADSNNDGIIKKEEFLNLAISPSIGGAIDTKKKSFSVNIESSFAKINDGYIPVSGKKNIVNNLAAITVDEAFNALLKFDKDRNSSLAQGELTNEQELRNIYEHVESNDSIVMMEKYKIGSQTIIYEEYAPSRQALKSMADEQKAKLEQGTLNIKEEAQQAAKKLLASNGDESVLTAEEKEALGAELKAIQKRLETKDELSDVKDEVAEKITETRFLDTIG